MRIKMEEYDVGVVTARFQVATLHAGHRALLDAVTEAHDSVMVFLGNAPTKGTKNNPLPFQARKQMVLEHYPRVDVHYINDESSDELWSEHLDRMVDDNLTPSQTAVLYGGRDSFAEHYHGRLPVVEFEPDVWVSGTEDRHSIWGSSTEASESFRRGVIWATSNRFPSCMPTVDVAIFDEAGSRLLLAMKPRERELRFVGGFVEVGETLETAARREVMEETTLAITDPTYVASVAVDDWRYRGEPDMGITTSLFRTTAAYGRPTPSDDLKGGSLHWVSVSELTMDMLTPAHRPLLVALGTHIAKTTEEES